MINTPDKDIAIKSMAIMGSNIWAYLPATDHGLPNTNAKRSGKK